MKVALKKLINLFNLGLFVKDVLAYYGVIFLELQLMGSRLLVLGGGVEMAGIG
jgi:hypothetical protein